MTSATLTPDLALVAMLEERLVNAWPSFEVELAGGWLLRFAEGYSKRANAATPLVPGAGLDAALVRHVTDTYAARGLPACFRLTGLEAPGSADLLAGLGFVDHDPSLGLVAPVPPAVRVDPDATIRPAAKTSWIDAAAASYGGAKADRAKLARIVRLIRQPAAFASLALDGEDVAWGLGVAERGFVGLYDIVVAPHLRGLGLGRRLVSSLLAWGREQGATRAYLQVREGNAAARALYGSLGFETSYRYRHGVQAGAAEGEAPARPEAPADED